MSEWMSIRITAPNIRAHGNSSGSAQGNWDCSQIYEAVCMTWPCEMPVCSYRMETHLEHNTCSYWKYNSQGIFSLPSNLCLLVGVTGLSFSYGLDMGWFLVVTAGTVALVKLEFVWCWGSVTGDLGSSQNPCHLCHSLQNDFRWQHRCWSVDWQQFV